MRPQLRLLWLKELPDLFFVSLASGQRVNFSFAVEEQGVFAYGSRERFVRIHVYYEHAALLTDEVIVDFERLLLFQLVEVLELQGEQFCPFFEGNLPLDFLNNEKLQFLSQ